MYAKTTLHNQSIWLETHLSRRQNFNRLQSMKNEFYSNDVDSVMISYYVIFYLILINVNLDGVSWWNSENLELLRDLTTKNHRWWMFALHSQSSCIDLDRLTIKDEFWVYVHNYHFFLLRWKFHFKLLCPETRYTKVKEEQGFLESLSSYIQKPKKKGNNQWFVLIIKNFLG